MSKNLQFLVGDANGVDSLIQQYLVTNNYPKENAPNIFKSRVTDRYPLIRVANEVKEMNKWNDNFIPVVYANAELKVTGMKLYKTDFFTNHNFESMHNKLQMDAFNLSGTSAFPVVTDATWNKLSPSAQLGLEIQLKNGIKRNCFIDEAIPGSSIINKHHNSSFSRCIQQSCKSSSIK